MKLDLSKFKKIECDDKCTTLEHPGGHTIQIAHKGISEDLKKQLDELPAMMAKGGMAKFSQKFDPNIKKASKPAQSSTMMPGSPTEAKSSYTEPQDAGPDVVLNALNKKAPPFGPLGMDSSQHYPPCINPSCKSYGRSHPNCRCYGGMSEHTGPGEAGHFASGGEVNKEYYCDNNRSHFKACEYYSGGEVKGVHKSYYDDGEGGESKAGALARNIDLGKGRKENAVAEHHKILGEIHSMKKPKLQGLAEGGEAEPQVQPELASSPAPEPTPDGGQELPQTDTLAPSPEVAPEQAAPEDNKQDLDKEINQADQAADRAPAAVATAPVSSPVEQITQSKDSHMADLSNEASAYQSDINSGHIKPETYHDLFAKKDTLGKIGTLFGLLVGGAGSGLSHQPNVLMEMMNKEIDRDLQYQQHSVENKQNFLKINQQALMTKANSANITAEGNIKANALAKVQANYTALHSLVQDTLKLPPGSPQRMKAEQTLGILNQSVQNDNFNILDRAATASALSGFLTGGGGGKNTTAMKSGLFGPEVKEVGEDTEQKNIPGFGMANRPVQESDRTQIQAMKVLSDKAQDLMDFSKGNIGTLSPAKRAVAKQKAEEMINFYNQSLASGALTQGRLGWLDDQIKKNPTGVVTQLMGNNQRLNEIKSSNDHRRNLLLQSYGVPIPKQKHTQDSGTFKMVNGVKYKKGPKGEAIKVE